VLKLAVVSPLLFSLVFGFIGFGQPFTAQHTMDNAARDGAPAGALVGSTVGEVKQHVRSFLEPMELADNVSIEISDATIDDPFVRVRLTAPREYVSLVGKFLRIRQRQLRGGSGDVKSGHVTLRP